MRRSGHGVFPSVKSQWSLLDSFYLFKEVYTVFHTRNPLQVAPWLATGRNACFAEGVIRGTESPPYPHRPLLGSVLYMKRGIEKDESFGLRHQLSFGEVSEVPEGHLRAGGGPGTSETDGRGDLRGVRHRDPGDGDYEGPHPSAGVVPAISIDRGGREDYQEPERAGAVSRVPGAQEKTLGRGTVGRRILRPDGRRPNDSGRDRQVYRATSPTRARACAACFEAALLMPRGLPRGYLLP